MQALLSSDSEEAEPVEEGAVLNDPEEPKIELLLVWWCLPLLSSDEDDDEHAPSQLLLADHDDDEVLEDALLKESVE
jgi:hypothetical protein